MLASSSLRSLAGGLVMALTVVAAVDAEELWVTYEGTAGPGKGKHVVLVAGDDEYRSEETLPQLGKILAVRHGFKCTVLFPIDPATGEIKPDHQTNIPGLEALDTADLCVMCLRFRNLPDEQMKHLADYIESGKPIVALRTSTHAFTSDQKGAYGRYHWQSKEWDGGFGRQLLGETWISHHGNHGSEATRGILAKEQAKHPILRGLKDGEIFGPTDVYGVRLPLPEGCVPLVYGQVVAGMKPEDKAVEGKKNDPMMPVAWVREYAWKNGKKSRLFTTTMGASQDFENAGVRKLIVQACYWGLGMEDQIGDATNVELVGEYKPTRFSFGGFTKGVKPAAHVLKK